MSNSNIRNHKSFLLSLVKKSTIAVVALLPCLNASMVLAKATQETQQLPELAVIERVEDKNNSNIASSDELLLAQRAFPRVNFSWREAPSVQGWLSFEVLASLFNGDPSTWVVILGLLMSGNDFYIVKAKINNTGNVPVRVYPSNIIANYPGGSTYITPVPDNRFFQPDILQPGYYIEKPVLFIAPATTTTNNVRMGYRDNSIQVTYN